MNHDPSNMFEMCERLLCRLDEAGTNGYFAAGPALEGTACRNDSGQNNADFCVQVITFFYLNILKVNIEIYAPALRAFGCTRNSCPRGSELYS